MTDHRERDLSCLTYLANALAIAPAMHEQLFAIAENGASPFLLRRLRALRFPFPARSRNKLHVWATAELKTGKAPAKDAARAMLWALEYVAL